MKSDKKQKKARNPGKLTLSDYKVISQNLEGGIDNLTEGTSMFSKLSATKDRVDYLIARLERKAKEPKKQKPEPIKWRCASCNQIHDKRITTFKCANCGSENLEKFSE